MRMAGYMEGVVSAGPNLVTLKVYSMHKVTCIHTGTHKRAQPFKT